MGRDSGCSNKDWNLNHGFQKKNRFGYKGTDSSVFPMKVLVNVLKKECCRKWARESLQALFCTELTGDGQPPAHYPQSLLLQPHGRVRTQGWHCHLSGALAASWLQLCPPPEGREGSAWCQEPRRPSCSCYNEVLLQNHTPLHHLYTLRLKFNSEHLLKSFVS